VVGTHRSGNRQTKDYGLLLFLAPELQLGLARLQVQRGLGRTYAGLLAFTRGLRVEDCISEEAYERLKEKYSEKLVRAAQLEQPRTLGDLREKQRIEELARNFGNVLGQWVTMNDKARLFWVKKARENQTVPNALLILDLSEKEATQIE